MNVEQIYELDKKFLQDLEERMEKWWELFKVHVCFISILT